MSRGDPKCLLSMLWQKGSAVALKDFRAEENKKNIPIIVSNNYIKKMFSITELNEVKNVKTPRPKMNTSFSNEDWDTEAAYDFSKLTKIKQTRPIQLYYGHLSVSPKEIATAELLDWQSGTAYLSITKDGKEEKGLFLEEGQQIFESVRKHPFSQDVMDAMRESERSDSKTKVLLSFVQEDKDTKRTIRTIGPKIAMKRIFFFDVNKDEKPIRTPAGNMVLQCNGKKTGKRPYFKRELKGKVQVAYEKQKNIFECFQYDEENRNNLVPYLTNVFAVDWYSKLEVHLYRLHCSAYLDKNRDRLPMYTMYGSKLEEKMKQMVLYTDKQIELDMNKDWWKTWIKEYKQELKDNKNKKHKNIRNSMIHKKYKSLRQKQRIRPPTKWLSENHFLSCP